MSHTGIIYYINQNFFFFIFLLFILGFQHTWCAVLIIIEGAFIKHKYPKNRVGLGLLTFASVGYLLWLVCQHLSKKDFLRSSLPELQITASHQTMSN